MIKNADLTICIPAYNNNESLERALILLKTKQLLMKLIFIFLMTVLHPQLIKKDLNVSKNTLIVSR